MPIAQDHRFSNEQEGIGFLEFDLLRNKTVVKRAYAKAPLRFLTPRNHGHASWVYISNYGGGLVGGDKIALNLDLRSHSKAVLLTQSSTKVYKSQNPSSQTLRAKLEANASLVILPDPLVCFADSKFSQVQRFDLEDKASLLLVDTILAGRGDSGERWLFKQLKNQMSVYREGKLLFFESVLLDSGWADLPARMGRFNALSLVLFLGPDFSEFGKEISESLKHTKLAPSSEIFCTANALSSEGTLLRIAGASIEAVNQTIRAFLSFLPDYLGESPWARKF